MTDKKDHGDMDRFVWAADHIKVRRKSLKDPQKDDPDQLPSDDQTPKTPKKGG